MNNYLSDINNAISALSLLFVFLTVLFNIRYNEIKEMLCKYKTRDIPKVGDSRREKFLDKIRWFYIWNCLPQIIIELLIIIISIPYIRKIKENCQWNYWNLHFSSTAFVIIFILILVLTAWSWVLARQIFQKCKFLPATNTDDNQPFRGYKNFWGLLRDNKN